MAPYTRGRVDFPRPLHKFLAEIRKAARYNLLYLQELHQCNRGRATRQADPIRGTDAAPTSKGARPAMCNKLLQVGNFAAELTTDERNGREQRETRHADPKRQHGANYGAGISCYTCTGIRAAMCNKLLQVDKRGADQTRSRKNWNRCGRDQDTAEQSRSRSGRQCITCYTCILWHYASTAL